MPSSDFGISRHGHAIHEIAAGGTVHTGIAHRVQIAGIVPWFEEFDTMVRSSHTPKTWEEIGPFSRAEAVAHRRLAIMISLHEGEAVTTHAERKQAKGRAKK